MYNKIHRDITEILRVYAKSFRSVLIVGPRQSGKTTIAKQTFTGKAYVSLENPDEYELANQDPRAFLNRFVKGAILDEVQLDMKGEPLNEGIYFYKLMYVNGEKNGFIHIVR